MGKYILQAFIVFLLLTEGEYLNKSIPVFFGLIILAAIVMVYRDYLIERDVK